MTITAAPGQVFSPGDWDALFAQHGRWSPGDSSPANVSAKPADEAYTPRDKTQPVYRYFLKDGTTVDARTSPDGQGWEIVKYAPSASFQQTQTAAGQAANRPTVGRVEGTPTGQGDPSGQPAYDNTKPIWVERDEAGKQVGAAKPLTADQREQWERDKNGGKTDAELRGASDTKPLEGYPGWSVRVTKQGNETRTEFVNPQGVAAPDPRPSADRPQVVPGTLNTTSPQIGSLKPDGSIAWAPNPNYQKPDPKPISVPPTQKWIIWQDADGSTRTEQNPNYRPPSKIERDPNTGRLQEITEDADGRPVVRDVHAETTVKPADIPILQTKYGEIAQGLGQLAQDLNGRVSRGEITEQQRDAAFKAAHEQASTAVDEINGILNNSRASWAQEIQQRGQTYTEAANRRSYAGSILNNAVGEGSRVAMSAGPGHGKEIAGGVAALLGIGQRYAQGMGGLPDMGEIPMPRALQQARDVGLPGLGPPSGAGAPGGGSAGMAPSPPRMSAVRGIDPGFAAPPPQPDPDPGFTGAAPPSDLDPGFKASLPGAGMGAQMGAGAAGSPVGVPVAAGGNGYLDLDGLVRGMLGDNADPTWADAVKRAAASASRFGGTR